MLFKCRFCGRFADDGDIQGCICLDCIEENPVGYVNQRFIDKKILVDYLKNKKNEIKEVK